MKLTLQRVLWRKYHQVRAVDTPGDLTDVLPRLSKLTPLAGFLAPTNPAKPTSRRLKEDWVSVKNANEVLLPQRSTRGGAVRIDLNLSA